MVIWIAGWFIIALGILFFTRPQIIKFITDSIIYAAALLRIAIAIIFFVGAFKCRLPWVIITLGCILLISGIMVFAVGTEKIKTVINVIREKPLKVIRFLGLIPVIVGIIVLYAA